MKMFIVFLLSTSFVFAEEPVVSSAPEEQESAATAVTQTSEEQTSEAPEATVVAEKSEDVTEPEIPELAKIECQDFFLEYLKKQPKAVQEKNMKTYFAMSYSTGREFINTVENEFEWKKKESEYKNKYKELLSEKNNYAISSNVKFGKYDFKKEHFPIEFELKEKDVLGYFSSGFMMGGSGYTGSWLSCDSPNMGQPEFDTAKIKISNLKKQYFFKVDPKTAEKITGFLRGDRQRDVKITFIPKVATGKLVKNYLFKGKFKFALELKGEISELFFNFHEAPELGKISMSLK